MAENRPGGKTMQLRSLGRVLLVDDNDRYADALTADLQARGAEVIRAYDATEGVRRLREEDPPFDGVVTDISMETQVSGLRVLREARRRGIRLIAVASTGLDTPIGYFLNRLILGRLLGGTHLIPKRPIKQRGEILWIPTNRDRRG